MTVRRDPRRPGRPWIIDFTYKDTRTGEKKRYFKNALLKTADGARKEERRLLATIAEKGYLPDQGPEGEHTPPKPEMTFCEAVEIYKTTLAQKLKSSTHIGYMKNVDAYLADRRCGCCRRPPRPCRYRAGRLCWPPGRRGTRSPMAGCEPRFGHNYGSTNHYPWPGRGAEVRGRAGHSDRARAEGAARRGEQEAAQSDRSGGPFPQGNTLDGRRSARGSSSPATCTSR